MTRYACPRCHDVGWVEEPYYSDFQPTTRPVVCPECNAGVVPTTRREVFEILIAFAVLLGLVVWAAR